MARQLKPAQLTDASVRMLVEHAALLDRYGDPRPVKTNSKALGARVRLGPAHCAGTTSCMRRSTRLPSCPRGSGRVASSRRLRMEWRATTAGRGRPCPGVTVTVTGTLNPFRRIAALLTRLGLVAIVALLVRTIPQRRASRARKSFEELLGSDATVCRGAEIARRFDGIDPCARARDSLI